MLNKSDKIQGKIGRKFCKILLKYNCEIYEKERLKMKFSEKITNLRKQKGLSQEELGYELNVTRQTVSKWELGQTTPEMDKLVQMSKIFGVSLDELTCETEIINNESVKIEDQPIKDKTNNNKILKVVLLIVGILIICGIIVYVFVVSKIINYGKDVFDKSSEIREKVYEGLEEGIEQYNKNGEKDKINIEEIYNESQEIIEETNKIEETQQKVEQFQEQISEQIENTREQMTEEQKLLLEQAEQKKQEVNEKIESAKEQMTEEQKALLEQAQQKQQEMLQKYQ